MAGIVATMKAHHALGRFGQPVHQLAFAFVAPLGAHNDYVAAMSDHVASNIVDHVAASLNRRSCCHGLNHYYRWVEANRSPRHYVGYEPFDRLRANGLGRSH